MNSITIEELEAKKAELEQQMKTLDAKIKCLKGEEVSVGQVRLHKLREYTILSIESRAYASSKRFCVDKKKDPQEVFVTLDSLIDDLLRLRALVSGKEI